jgi:predicted enzyme related to lactoylglutathione lyase
MATRLVSVVIDANDVQALARFWAEATGWPVTSEADDEVVVGPPDPAVHLVIGTVPEPKQSQNRIHLDLATSSAEDQATTVGRLLAIGATRIDVGQNDVPWVVMADPEGNELCVLEPRAVYEEAQPLAAIVVHAEDPEAMARFWTQASGWPPADNHPDTALRPPTVGMPFLEFVQADGPKTVKNRFHLDVAPYADDDLGVEVARLTGVGARRVDIGQGDVSWVVMADPEGQEFCVLSPRG